MKYSVLPNKEKGVVLILVLAFLTMFAMMVSAFLIITTNMSDSAVNSLALYEKGDSAADRSESDIDAGIKTLLTGTYNTSSPIGPFSILENLYGDQTTAEGVDLLAVQYYNLTAEYDANGVPVSAVVSLYVQPETEKYYGTNGTLVKWYEQRVAQLQEKLNYGMFDTESLSDTISKLQFEYNKHQSLSDADFARDAEELAAHLMECGNSVSFGRLQWMNTISDPSPVQEDYLETCSYFNDVVSGSTALIYNRSVERDEDGVPVRVVFRLAMNEELKKFFTKYIIPARDADGNENLWPLNVFSDSSYYNLSANLRLNPKPFSGTGAGDFIPNESLDGQLTTEQAQEVFFPGEESENPSLNGFRLPYAFWGNAAAPDMTPYLDLNGNISFQTFWHHLLNRRSCPYAAKEGAVLPSYENGWAFAPDADVTPQETVRMNPGYTSADSRSLFLGKVDAMGSVTPSFVRTEPFLILSDAMNRKLGSGNEQEWLSVLRKMSPRPLHIDHWKWTGGNGSLSPEIQNEDGNLFDGSREQTNRLVNQTVSMMVNSGLQNTWDVDNDNDGVKDGIWIPSGLPIRIDENGNPYATMYSFTVLDMDGRVNVNTAGNWNQLTDSDGYYNLESLARESHSDDPFSPWYSFEKLEGGLGWMDDADEPLSRISGRRGTGLGPAGIDLAAAFAKMAFTDKPGEAAAKALAERYSSPLYSYTAPEMDPVQRSDTNLFDGQSSMWNEVALRGQLKQPSAYPGVMSVDDAAGRFWTWNPSLSPDDSDHHRRFFLHTDPIYSGDLNAENADPNKFVFPWRGKTRVSEYGTARNPKSWSVYPTFDFCDTALRTYDPLGNDILTYLPQYSENPYLVDPYASTLKDSTFAVEALETLLRPFDYDRKIRDRSLLSVLDLEDQLNHAENDRFSFVRRGVTTISSDIPVPSQAFPVGVTEVQDGVFGIRELIRRCVVLEIYKASRETLFDEAFVDGLRGEFASTYSMSIDNDEGKQAFRRYVREKIESKIDSFKSGAVEQITNQLFALLPKDIQEGHRLDLNELSHKACWIDSLYEEEEGSNAFVALDLSEDEKKLQHGLGLVERMKFARGLYLLLMALTYEDRNAEVVADFYDSDPSSPLTDDDQYKNYLEGYDKEFLNKLKAKEGSGETDDEAKERYTEELIANRIAQYCVNMVDFTDPDATMTPFFYDPNPFDGWWSYRDKDADWIDGDKQVSEEGTVTGGSDDLFFVLFTPAVDQDAPDLDFYDALIPEQEAPGVFSGNESYFTTPDKKVADGSEFKNSVNKNIKDGSGTPIEFLVDGDTYAQAIVAWINGQSSEHTKIGEDDFGFRIVWGMERPDLLLTETLSFHDHGIADTKYEKAGGHGETVSGDDADYDQVRRPLGSAYLELYCTANPNIPQSPELYQFDKDRSLWKLELSKMTPRQGADSPYSGKEFPIWRVAITASSDPRKNEEADKEFTDKIKDGDSTIDVTYKRTIRKKGNSVIERLLGDDADWRTFSFRTRQFCDLVQKANEEKKLDEKLDPKWRGYDYTAANILGPSAAGGTKNGDPDFAGEVDIDRLVWFGWPKASEGSKFELINGYPDATHIFSRVKETEGDDLNTFIYPNQYLVVAPAEKRSIGSKYKNKSYFGVPSSMKLSMSRLRESKSGDYTNSDYILAGTYFGIDVNSDDKYEVNKRGLNISEPLWTGETDPYPTTIPTQDKEIDGDTVTVTVTEEEPVPNNPFDLPGKDHKKDNYPVAADHLLGVGVVPGYRSAFVQRVADPNRPYHPCSNPYISVDWNMMDLALFTGEANDQGYSAMISSDSRFYKSSDEGGETETNNEIDAKNHIVLAKSALITADNGYLEFDPYTKNSKSLFASRGWLDREAKGFYPEKLQNDLRPNFWGRALDKETLQKDNTAGLPQVGNRSDLYKYLTDLYDDTELKSGTDESLDETNVVYIFPRHSLGAYNTPERRVVDLDGQFADASHPEDLRKLYYGSPAKSKESSEFQPFEYLLWNDAPFNSPAEALFVPASAPGRFGLEFVRNSEMKDAKSDDGLTLGTLYQDAEGDKKSGRSLGSDGGTKKNLFGWEMQSSQTGSYLNFHHSSAKRGESLNLSALFDFVTIPSLYNGTKTFCGYDKNGDPLYVSNLREPGKLNLNTMRESGWNGILSIWQDDDQEQTNYQVINNRYVVGGQSEEGEEESGDASDFLSLRVPFLSAQASRIFPDFPRFNSEGKEEEKTIIPPGDATLLAKAKIGEVGEEEEPSLMLDSPANGSVKKNNLYTATEELRKLAGLTTTRSNVFAVWMTVGYFKVERAQPGLNMPLYDPDGNSLLDAGIATRAQNGSSYLDLQPGDKYYEYYRAIYPDGYTYGKELGTEGIDEGGVNRPRAFYLIDRSIPVDFRRGRSWNWDDIILLERKL